METPLFNTRKEELQDLKELLLKDETLKVEKVSKIQLIILSRLEQLENHYEEFSKRWMTPLIHLDEKK